MNAAAYVRVSSRSQDYATQRDALKRAAKARGDRIKDWFEEKRTAKKLERPALQSLRDAVRAGEVSKLYVFRLDRLTRSGIRDTLGLLEELQHGGCTVVTVGDGFDLGGQGIVGQVVVAVMAWAASMERLALGERIAAARVRVEKSGGHWGRPVRVDRNLAKQMADLRAQGKTIRYIAAALKTPRSTVDAVLSGKGPYAKAKKKYLPAGNKKAVRSLSD